MRRSSEVNGQGLVMGGVSPASGLSRWSASAARSEAWWATLGLMVPLLGLVAGQAVLVLRRYGASPATDSVNVTVAPSSGALTSETLVDS